ncbi:hypothetical protein U1Q18_044194 [Sarracenia purpurea var. burkii]
MRICNFRSKPQPTAPPSLPEMETPCRKPSPKSSEICQIQASAEYLAKFSFQNRLALRNRLQVRRLHRDSAPRRRSMKGLARVGPSETLSSKTAPK